MLDLSKPILRALPPKVREPQRRTNSAPVKEETGNRRRLYWLAALLVLVAVIGAGAWRFFLRPLTVQIAPVAINVPEQVFGLGTVGADVQSTVGFKVAGVINEIDANEGDHVKTGHELARLAARDVEAQVAQARAAVRSTKERLMLRWRRQTRPMPLGRFFHARNLARNCFLCVSLVRWPERQPLA